MSTQRWCGILSVLSFLVSLCSADEELVVLNVIYRHGDRAPTRELPIDAFNESHWQNGYGQLTDLGKAEQYRLGQHIRISYDESNVLGDVFDYRKVYVRSSDVDRCLISAYSNLAGLYSRNSDVAADFDLPYETWQPFPVHSVPEDDDEVIALGKTCNNANLLIAADLFASAEARSVNADYAAFYDFLNERTNVSFAAPRQLLDAFLVGDTLKAEKIHNNDELPVEWAGYTNITCNNNPYIACENRTVYDILRSMTDLFLSLLYRNPSIHKYKGGPLLRDVVTKLEDFASKDTSVTFNMYSGHDITVVAVLQALGVYDDISPEYAAAVFIELWASRSSNPDEETTYTVKFKYRNKANAQPSDQPVDLAVRGCPDPCSLDDFKAMLEPYRIDDWEVECGNLDPDIQTTSTDGSVNSAALITAGMVVKLSIGIVAAVLNHSGGFW